MTIFSRIIAETNCMATCFKAISGVDLRHAIQRFPSSSVRLTSLVHGSETVRILISSREYLVKTCLVPAGAVPGFPNREAVLLSAFLFLPSGKLSASDGTAFSRIRVRTRNFRIRFPGMPPSTLEFLVRQASWS